MAHLAYAGSSPYYSSSSYNPFTPKGAISAPIRRKNVQRRAQLAWAIPTPSWSPWNRKILFNRVRILENRSLPQEHVRALFDPLIGLNVEKKDVEEAVSGLSEWYHRNGYLFSAVIVDSWPTSSSTVLILRCIESLLEAIELIPVSKDGVELKDGTKVFTRPRVIARALGMQMGKPFKWEPTSFNGLMNLGIFSKSWVECAVTGEDRITLKVFIVEQPRGRIEPGIGMNQDGRVYGDISYLDRNFMGRAQSLRIEWQKRLDMARAAGGIEFVDNRVGAKYPISYSVRAFRRSDSTRSLPSEDRPRGEANANEVRLGPIRSFMPLESDSDRDGLVADANYRFAGGAASIKAGPIAERIYWRELDLTGSVQQRNIDQLAWKSALHYNKLQPFISPREGHRFSVEHTLGGVIRGVFHKLVVGLSQNIPMTQYANLHISTVFGVGSTNVPPHEMTVLGGHGSVRGYMYGELGRTQSWRTSRLEFQVPLTHSGKAMDVTKGTAPVREPIGPGESKGKIIQPGTPALGPKLTSSRGPALFERLPTLTAYLFGDAATRGAFDSSISGSSIGVGLRIAELVNVELTRAAHGREPKLTVSLVDHRIHS